MKRFDDSIYLVDKRVCLLHQAGVIGTTSASLDQIEKAISAAQGRAPNPDRLIFTHGKSLRERSYCQRKNDLFRLNLAPSLIAISMLSMQLYLLSKQCPLVHKSAKGIFFPNFATADDRKSVGASIIAMNGPSGHKFENLDSASDEFAVMGFGVAFRGLSSKLTESGMRISAKASAIPAMFCAMHEYWHIYGGHFEIRADLNECDVDEDDLMSAYRGMEYLADGASAVMVILSFCVELTYFIKEQTLLSLEESLNAAAAIAGFGIGSIFMVEGYRESWIDSAFSGHAHPTPIYRFAALKYCLWRWGQEQKPSLIRGAARHVVAGLDHAISIVPSMFADGMGKLNLRVVPRDALQAAKSDIVVLKDLYSEGDWPQAGRTANLASPEKSLFVS